MNCPKCKTGYLSRKALFYPHPPINVYKCSNCHARFTEKMLDEWPICAACGELLDYDQVSNSNDEGGEITVNSEESICRKCAEKFNENDVPWE